MHARIGRPPSISSNPRAQFDPERVVLTRVAEHADRVYLDLADERWRAVEIGPDGCQVLASPQSARRPAGMLPLSGR